MWMNESDIKIMANNQHACPNVTKGVRVLYLLMQAVNAQSDGWHMWPAPGRAAERLMNLLQSVGNKWYDTHGTITDAELKKALRPIRSMVTRQQKIQARHGNTFEFDVDAALEGGRCVASKHCPTCGTLLFSVA